MRGGPAPPSHWPSVGNDHCGGLPSPRVSPSPHTSVFCCRTPSLHLTRTAAAPSTCGSCGRCWKVRGVWGFELCNAGSPLPRPVPLPALPMPCGNEGTRAARGGPAGDAPPATPSALNDRGFACGCPRPLLPPAAMGQKPTEEELFQMISEVDDNMSGTIGECKQPIPCLVCL